MIDRHTCLNKVSSYQVVVAHILVQNPIAKTRCNTRSRGQIPSFDGVILEQRGLDYKAQYLTDEDFSPISQIISKTKITENGRIKALSNNLQLVSELSRQLRKMVVVPVATRIVKLF